MSAKTRHRTGSSSLRHTKDFLAAGQYDSRPAPQWMKTLQDKYEKLHVKIESYSQRPPSVNRYSPSFGKGNSLNRTDKLTLPPSQSLSIGSTEQRRWTFPHSQPMQRRNRGTSHTEKKSNRVSSDVVNVHDAYSGVKARRKAQTFERADEIEKEGSSDCERGKISIINDNKLENNNASTTKTESTESCERLTQSSNQSNVVKTYSKTNLANEQGNTRDNDANNNQSVQAHIGGDKGKEKSKKSKGNNKSTRKQLKLFSRMSMEARHAISETINAMDDDSTTHKERRESSQNKKVKRNKNKNHEVCVENDKNDEKTNTSKSETFSDVVEAVNENKDDFKSQCLGEYSEWDNFIKYDESENSTDISKTYSTHGDFGTRLHPCLFGGENVISSTYLNQRKYPSQYKGNGRYAMRMPRERTFEITPVGFDVRYRDTIAIGQPDDDAPTGEIRAHAVAKCTEWLKKYAPD